MPREAQICRRAAAACDRRRDPMGRAECRSERLVGGRAPRGIVGVAWVWPELASGVVRRPLCAPGPSRTGAGVLLDTLEARTRAAALSASSAVRQLGVERRRKEMRHAAAHPERRGFTAGRQYFEMTRSSVTALLRRRRGPRASKHGRSAPASTTGSVRGRRQAFRALPLQADPFEHSVSGPSRRQRRPQAWRLAWAGDRLVGFVWLSVRREP
jgi:hypothetical protein